MGPLFKVFIAATGGVLLGAFVEPQITPRLPGSLAGNPTAGKVIHASIGGGSAVVIYWALGKTGAA